MLRSHHLHAQVRRGQCPYPLKAGQPPGGSPGAVGPSDPALSPLSHPLHWLTGFSPLSSDPSCPLFSEKLAGLKLEVEEIALTEASQRRKLALVLEAANRSLQVEEQQARWSMEGTWGPCPGLGSGRARGSGVPSRCARSPSGASTTRGARRGSSLRQAGLTSLSTGVAAAKPGPWG